MVRERVTLHASAAEVASGTTAAATAPPGWQYATGVIKYTAKAGSGSVNGYLQQSHDGGTTWQDLAAFTQYTAVTTGERHLVRIQAGGRDSATTVWKGATATLALGTTRRCYWPAKLRLQFVISGFTSVTFECWVDFDVPPGAPPALEQVSILSYATRANSSTSVFSVPEEWTYTTIMFETTAFTGAGTEDVWIQCSTDGGTTYGDVGHFTQYTGAAASERYFMRLASYGIDSAELAYKAAGAVLGAGLTRLVMHPDDMRIQWTKATFADVTFGVIGWFETL